MSGRTVRGPGVALVTGAGMAAFLVVLVSTMGIGAYGWTLFVGTPFFVGWFFSSRAPAQTGKVS